MMFRFLLVGMGICWASVLGAAEPSCGCKKQEQACQCPKEKCECVTQEIQTMYELHCQHRERHGLVRQVLDLGLCRQAQRLAEANASAGVMRHSSWGVNENVAIGSDPVGSIQMWIRSGGHNANLLCGAPCVGFGYSGGHAVSIHAQAHSGADWGLGFSNVRSSTRVRVRSFSRVRLSRR